MGEVRGRLEEFTPGEVKAAVVQAATARTEISRFWFAAAPTGFWVLLCVHVQLTLQTFYFGIILGFQTGHAGSPGALHELLSTFPISARHGRGTFVKWKQPEAGVVNVPVNEMPDFI